MPGTIAATHVQVSQCSDDVCGDCLGTSVSVDDGQLTGLPGVLVPCVCVPGSWASCSQCPERPADACGCWVACWPVNAGHTGWVPLPLDDIEDDGLLYRPCPVHPPVFRTAVTAEVAA